MTFFYIKNIPYRFYSQTLKSCLAAALLLSANGLANAAPLTSWDKKIDNAELRFKVLPELGGVLDFETQLVWEQLADNITIVRWDNAVRRCNQLKQGNRFGWRLPTLAEVTTLLDVRDPTNFPSGHPLNPPPSIWTSTQTGLGSNSVWFIDTGYGLAFKATKDSYNGAWCVRGKHPGYN